MSTAITRVVIVGGAGGSKIALDIFSLQGFDIAGFMNNHAAAGSWGSCDPKLLGSVETESNIEFLRRPGINYFVATGDNAERERVVNRLQATTGKKPMNAIHPSAIISPLAEMGRGNLINAASVVNAFASIGDGTIINTSAVVEHDCVLEDYAQVSPGTVLAGYVRVRKRAFLGVGVRTIPRITIGEDAVIAAGAVVIRDVEAGVLAAGIPAVVKKSAPAR